MLITALKLVNKSRLNTELISAPSSMRLSAISFTFQSTSLPDFSLHSTECEGKYFA